MASDKICGPAKRGVPVAGAVGGIGKAIAQASAALGCRTLQVDRDGSRIAAARRAVRMRRAITTDIMSHNIARNVHFLAVDSEPDITAHALAENTGEVMA